MVLQLLEEVCALGRDNSYVCQKSSGKMDQQHVFNTQSNNNSASSDDDDEDDDVASTHSETTLKQPTPSFTDPQYVNACVLYIFTCCMLLYCHQWNVLCLRFNIVVS